MISVQAECVRPLACHLGAIGGITYHGCGYALPDPRCCGVVKLDQQLCPLQTVETLLKYTDICYSEKEGCYWAAAGESANLLYQLDQDFREIRQLRVGSMLGQRLCGMGCGCCEGEDGLWLALPKCIVFVNTRSGLCRHLPCGGSSRRNTGILCLGECRLVSYTEGCRQVIEIFCPDCCECFEFLVPGEYCLEAMVLCGSPNMERAGGPLYEVRLLLLKLGTCEKFVMDCHICCGCDCCDDHDCCRPHPCHDCCDDHDCCRPHPCCDCCDDHGCCRPHPCCDCNARWEVIHSIALQEAGIAHILNAEGEKLQKAVAISDKIEELICVNESVKRMVTQISQLEGQLYSKLEAVTACSKPCGKHD